MCVLLGIFSLRGLTVAYVRVESQITIQVGRLHRLTGSALDHTSLPPELESRRGHI